MKIANDRQTGKVLAGLVAAMACCMTLVLCSCGSNPENQSQQTPTTAADTSAARSAGADLAGSFDASTGAQSIASVDDMPNAEVRFGTNGESFTYIPEKNDSALFLMRNITSAGRNLPIYTYEGYEGDDVMQYYDVPARFDAPSNPTRITSEKAGEVYLSDPNRIMLFFEDANMEGKFTYIGAIADVSGLADAVRNNPTVPGYSNKIISVSYE